MEELVNLLSEGRYSFLKTQCVELNAAIEAAELKVAELEAKVAQEADDRKTAELKVAELKD
ncbi:MAG: hypothetical protein LBI10_10085 [Deltaproteobacteria bacterium]|nr:hypothetical protein [Deltaproteobacteria bacterium]